MRLLGRVIFLELLKLALPNAQRLAAKRLGLVDLSQDAISQISGQLADIKNDS